MGKLTDNVWTLRRQTVQGGRDKRPTKAHLFTTINFFPKHYCLQSADLIEDVAKAVHVQGGQVVDAFQAKSLGAMARLDSKKEAGGTAENCTAIPGVTVRLKESKMYMGAGVL